MPNSGPIRYICTKRDCALDFGFADYDFCGHSDWALQSEAEEYAPMFFEIAPPRHDTG